MNENGNPESQAASNSPAQPAAERAAALQRIISELLPLRNDDRRNLIETLTTFFDLNLSNHESSTRTTATQPSLPTRDSDFRFSEEPSPKAFISDKAPKTDVERVACLAYYLAHFRATPHFKAKDITALNIESAHKRFSNPSLSVENATKMGYLVPSVKGAKQISASGEKFVEALPDREAAREVFERHRQRRAGGGKKDTTKTERE